MATNKPNCNVTVNGVSYYDPNAGTGVSACSSGCVLCMVGLCTYMTFQGNVNIAFIISVVVMIVCGIITARNGLAAMKDETTKDCVVPAAKK